MFKKDGVHIKIKDCYDKLFVIELARKIKAVKTDFDVNEFTDEVNKTLEDLEFSKRMQVISNNLHKQFINYEEALTIFTKILTPNVSSFATMYEEGKDMAPLSKYVEIFGIQNELHFEQTIEFIKKLTLAYTGEYALRSMFIVMPSKVIEIVKEWIKDKNPFIRRAAIESIRISLPWAKKTYNIMNYFQDYQYILDVLSTDENEYVRRSVANNINDLYKYDSKKADVIINKWKKENFKNPSKEMTKLINHATRYYRNVMQKNSINI